MSNTQKMCAVGTHLYTSTGIILSFLAAIALINQDIRIFLVSLFVAVLIDATDGTLARKCAISEILPSFDGAKLDDLIDYLTYVFLPSVGLIQFNVLSSGKGWLAVIPMLASLYGFCQEDAKTDESFVGFPSYWNIIFLYLYVLDISTTWTIFTLLFFSFLIFVPLRYVYPTKTRWMQSTTILLSTLYAGLMAIICLFPHSDWVSGIAYLSLIYPGYYMLISIMHHFRSS
jgi:phosphatidylcholine synthase